MTALAQCALTRRHRRVSASVLVGRWFAFVAFPAAFWAALIWAALVVL